MKKYKMLLAVSLIAIGLMSALVASINEKKAETKLINSVPQMDNRWETKSEEFRTHYPRQYDSWKKTSESTEVEDLLKKYPELVVMWAGYGFAKDYNSPRGHFYAIEDNRNTLRTADPKDSKTGPMPTACWTCKSPDVPRLMKAHGDEEYFTGKWAKYGSEIVNPIGCVDCHNPETMQLEINRQYLDDALKAAGISDLASATQQEMRSFVCAQCHSEYYFDKKDTKSGEKAMFVKLPWAKGTSAEQMEEYYDSINFSDWTHPISKTPMLKAQHPGYEMWKTGAHGKNNVACADCHMPYTQEGGVKYSDHQLIANPLDGNVQSCMVCHKTDEKSLRANIEEKKARKNELHKKAMAQLSTAHLEAGQAWKAGATKAEMDPILKDIRHAQWRWDYAVASHGSFFHAPEETLRVLGTALEKVGNARIKLAKVLAKHGAGDYKAPEKFTKEEAHKIIGLPYGKLVEDKEKFNNGLAKEWQKEAVEKGILNPDLMKGTKKETSYSK